MTSLFARDHNLQLRSESDALEAMSLGLSACIFTEDELHPEFFQLRNGIAGAVFQKLINYGFRAALIVPEPQRHGARLIELMHDHASHPCIRFFASEREAHAWLL